MCRCERVRVCVCAAVWRACGECGETGASVPLGGGACRRGGHGKPGFRWGRGPGVRPRPSEAPRCRFKDQGSERLGLRGDERDPAPDPEPTWASPRIQLPPKGTLHPVMSLCSQGRQVA